MVTFAAHVHLDSAPRCIADLCRPILQTRLSSVLHERRTWSPHAGSSSPLCLYMIFFVTSMRPSRMLCSRSGWIASTARCPLGCTPITAPARSNRGNCSKICTVAPTVKRWWTVEVASARQQIEGVDDFVDNMSAYQGCVSGIVQLGESDSDCSVTACPRHMVGPREIERQAQKTIACCVRSAAHPATVSTPNLFSVRMALLHCNVLNGVNNSTSANSSLPL